MRVRGNAIFPSSIGGRFSILFAILRQLALVLSVAIFSRDLRELNPDVFFVDQLSACIPLFRVLCPQAKVLFYGHFPDRLLAKEGSGVTKHLKRLYRQPFDEIESWSTGCADDIVVNSKFTRAVFKNVFSGMRSRELKVIYPCVDTNSGKLDENQPRLWPDKKVLLSINRYEEKKNLDLAISAYAGLSGNDSKKAKLVIAGGFDSRVPENANTLKHLQGLADSLNLSNATYKGNDGDMATDTNDVLFLLSIPGDLKRQLLHTTSLLIYTPKNEHFGIVPIEAMLARVPVLATNTGGPLETIYDGRTGWLRSPDKIEQWTDVMRKPLIPSSADTLQAMGQRGRERVLAEFSHTKMTQSLDQEVQKLCSSTVQRPRITPEWVFLLAYCTAIAVTGGILALGFTKYAMSLERLKQNPRNGSPAAEGVSAKMSDARVEL